MQVRFLSETPRKIHFIHRVARPRVHSSTVEQLPLKQLVAGSSPAVPTTASQRTTLSCFMSKAHKSAPLHCCSFQNYKQPTASDCNFVELVHGLHDNIKPYMARPVRNIFYWGMSTLVRISNNIRHAISNGARSSIGQDASFSSWKEEFDSPTGYQEESRTFVLVFFLYLIERRTSGVRPALPQ